MIVGLTIKCDWPGCGELLTLDFCTHRPQAPGWKAEADNPEWEIGESRITKLWIQRLADRH